MSDFHIETVFHYELCDDAIEYAKARARHRIGERLVMEATAMSPAIVTIKETMRNDEIETGVQRHRINLTVRNSEEARLRRALEKACEQIHWMDNDTCPLADVEDFVKKEACEDCSVFMTTCRAKDCWLQFFMDDDK